MIELKDINGKKVKQKLVSIKKGVNYNPFFSKRL